MPSSTPADPKTQHEHFRAAVDALGGTHALARALGCTPRHAGRLYSGNSPLHDGILRDTAAALATHAELCCNLERQLTPAFSGNLTKEQAERYGSGSGQRIGREN